MELIYNVIDGLVAMPPLKRFFGILGVLAILIPAIAAVYLLFRTYNLIGLGVLIFIFQILVPRDSILERIEMRRMKQNQQQA